MSNLNEWSYVDLPLRLESNESYSLTITSQSDTGNVVYIQLAEDDGNWNLNIFSNTISYTSIGHVRNDTMFFSTGTLNPALSQKVRVYSNPSSAQVEFYDVKIEKGVNSASVWSANQPTINRITKENADVVMGTAVIKGAHISDLAVDTLQIAGDAISANLVFAMAPAAEISCNNLSTVLLGTLVIPSDSFDRKMVISVGYTYRWESQASNTVKYISLNCKYGTTSIMDKQVGTIFRPFDLGTSETQVQQCSNTFTLNKLANSGAETIYLYYKMTLENPATPESHGVISVHDAYIVAQGSKK